MEMLNRAIEGAADFSAFRDALLRPGLVMQPPAVTIAKGAQAKPLPPKRPGENRRDYRARVLGAQKSQETA